ncbi:MAG: hypothetical protein EA360_05805 [Balneolaceae bacterium]|nr:MAG: hypothetical protein EA360_05805 [Balneolaceae bacterium]
MNARFVISLLIFLCLATQAQAQIYSTQFRAPGQEWMELRTDRFRVIYPLRYQQEAYRTLSILESDYPSIQELVGGSLRSFPVILNPDNDLSNGFVSPLNFRSEIEIAPIIGKSMNPRSGDWLELVVPHELVHALHFSVNPRSFTRAIGLLSPDLRRSVHAAAPLGVFEGIAVHHESHGSVPGAGRGNHPYFRNQFNALLESRQEWSMGQLLHVTDYTPPFDRHYIGGYEFTHWLLHAYGEDAVKDAIRFHYRYPFLGFGTALRHTTGNWPRTLYREFSASANAREALRRSAIAPVHADAVTELPFDASCSRLNRPVWTAPDRLLFHARSCNRAPGFYQMDLSSNRLSLVYEVMSAPDHLYNLSGDRSELYFSRYHPHPRYDNLLRGDLHRLDLSSGTSERLSLNARLYSPDPLHQRLLARQVQANELALVELDETTGERIREFGKPEESSVVQALSHPHNPTLAAIIGRVKSVQAVWLTDLEAEPTLFERPPDIVFAEGSVFDLAWHPAGETLLFVTDHTGSMNLYEYSLRDHQVVRITNSLFNAYEPSYSPDGTQIAFVGQELNEQKIYLLDRNLIRPERLQEEEWQYNPAIAALLERPLMNRSPEDLPDPSEWEPRPYRTSTEWLKPRLWTPVFEQEAGRERIGVSLESVDPMSRRSYLLDLNHYADRTWYNFEFTSKRFYPGFTYELFNTPNFTAFRVQLEDQTETLPVLQQSRGGALKVPVRIRFDSNARFSSLLIEPQYYLSQIRFLDAADTGRELSGFGTRHTIGLRSVLNLNVRQFRRDLQPNSGWVFFAETRYGLNSDELEIDGGRYTLTANLTQRKGVRAGVISYLAPLQRWNQTLRLSGQVISQTDVPVFNLNSLYSDLFSERPLGAVNSAAILNTRYTIPLTYPDQGGLLLPVYLSNIYLVLFTQTVSDLDAPDLMAASRTLYGAGIRSRFRLSNLAFDVGISVGWEPTRNEVTGFFGTF